MRYFLEKFQKGEHASSPGRILKKS